MKENGLSSPTASFELYFVIVLQSSIIWHSMIFFLTLLACIFYWDGNVLLSIRILALRKAEKDEEKRAMEKIRQKLEEDKVDIVLATAHIVINYSVLSF